MVENLRLALDQGTHKNHKATGPRGDIPAWKKATKIPHHAVLGNNPELLRVMPSVTSIWSSANDIHQHPWAEFIRNVQGPSLADEPFHGIDVDSPAPLARLGLHPLRAHSSVAPTRTTFHNQIYPLGMDDCNGIGILGGGQSQGTVV